MTYDPRASFLTHSNYVAAFDTLISSHYLPGKYGLLRPKDQVLEALAAQVRSSRPYGRLQPRPTRADIEAIVSALRNAWGTELLLAATGEIAHDELIGLANNWAVVQAYYAGYHAVQALVLARGEPRPQSHPTTQRQNSTFWAMRSVNLPPWSLGWHSAGCCNLPSDRTVNPIHPWTNCDEYTCWNLAAMALRTTREDMLKERFRKDRERKRSAARRAWQREEQGRLARNRRPRVEPRLPLPRLSQPEKLAIDRSLRPSTLLDYLYRLRIRSNYEDATMFTDGPEQAYESWAVHQSLCRITAATLLVHELLVGRLIGTATLCSIIDQWSGSSRIAIANIGVRARRSLLCT